MNRLLIMLFSVLLSVSLGAETTSDREAIISVVRDYIESQHNVEPERMQKGLDKKLVKRTYWETGDGSEFILETDFDSMIGLAARYNLKGDKFPATPRVDITILDIDQRVASVKLIVDEWIDYMHLYKNEKAEWKILNVLWQYHDPDRHR